MPATVLLARRINELCEVFEEAWVSGRSPEIERILGEVPESDSTCLLEQLLEIELEWRARRGETPAEAEYQARFPGRDDAVRAAFRWLASLTTPHDPKEASRASAMAETAPARIGPYALGEKLGGGGFGIVYRGLAPSGRAVAVKVLHAPVASQEDAERFRERARTIRRLQHRNLVRVLEAGLEGGRAYVVSDLIEGPTLRERLAGEGRRDPSTAARLVADLADALHHAHVTGLVHRDVKPANILLDRRGRAYLADFDLVATEEELDEQRHKIAGTLAYMSPEQIDGRTDWLDGRSDLFGLGAVLYELLCGRRPFRSTTLAELREEIGRRDPKPPRQIDPDVPEELERICLKCLQKRPEDRYATARDLARDLRRWLSRRHAPRRRMVLIGLSLLALGGMAIYRLSQPTQPPLPPPKSTLAELEFYVSRGGEPDDVRGHSLVVDGRDQEVEFLALGPSDAFKLQGRLTGPTYWYLLWFDTAGVVSIAARAAYPSKTFEYPEGDRDMIRVSTSDPEGIHLLVLVTGSLPPEGALKPLEERVATLGKPPEVRPGRWSQLRGAGSTRRVDVTLPAQFLRRIEGRLPEGLVLSHALFLSTEN